MCQESLINYLETKLQDKISKEDITFFIKYGDAYLEIEDKVESVASYEEIFPSSIKQNAKDIDLALKNVKICVIPLLGRVLSLLGLCKKLYVQEIH